MGNNTGIELDQEIVDILNEIKGMLAELAGSRNPDISPLVSELKGSVDGLGTKIDSLNGMLGKSREYNVNITVENADGAISDLVSRVVEEVIIRAKQENLLEIV